MREIVESNRGFETVLKDLSVFWKKKYSFYNKAINNQ